MPPKKVTVDDPNVNSATGACGDTTPPPTGNSSPTADDFRRTPVPETPNTAGKKRQARALRRELEAAQRRAFEADQEARLEATRREEMKG